MGKAKRRSRAAIAREALAALAELAGEGAYALPPASTESSEDACAVFASRAAANPATFVSRAAMSHALQNGWLEVEAGTDHIRATLAGLRAAQAARKPKQVRRQQVAPAARQEEGPLAWLRRRRNRLGQPHMTEAQINAGERFAAEFWRGGMSPRVTANWSAAAPRDRTPRATPGFGVEIADATLAARQRFFAALDAVGSDLGSILVDVCCHDLGLEAIERAARWPRHTARVVLGLGLKKLARHYGLLAPDPPARSYPRHWGDADYKPTLAAWR